MVKYSLLLICVFSYISISAQNFDDLDSLLVDRDIENYSIRIFTNLKANKFRIKNNSSKARYVPNNRHGLGFGFANRKIIVDIAFNLKNPNKEETRKFDLQGTTILKGQNYINLYLQTYKGFTAKNNFDEPFVFREDLKSASVGFNYLYTFDEIEFSYSLIKAGLSDQHNKSMFITGGVGVFASYDAFSANPSLLSETTSLYFNEQANMERYRGIALGFLGGLVSYFELPENITATVNVMPGIGFMYKRITLEDDRYTPSNPMVYKLDFLIGLSYNLNQFYVSLTYSNGIYSTDFDYGNSYLLKLTKAKLAVGYRFK